MGVREMGALGVQGIKQEKKGKIEEEKIRGIGGGVN